MCHTRAKKLSLQALKVKPKLKSNIIAKTYQTEII